MGSFSYSCALTGLPICGDDKVALIPLKMRDKYGIGDCSEEELRKVGTTHYSFGDHGRAFFVEGTYPIFGTYDEYGRIENIVKDDNTRLIEEYYQVSIEDFCMYLCDVQRDRWNTYDDSKCYGIEKKTPMYKEIIALSGTWIRREIYDQLKVNVSGMEFDDYESYPKKYSSRLEWIYETILPEKKKQFDITRERKKKLEIWKEERKTIEEKIICKFSEDENGIWLCEANGSTFLIEEEFAIKQVVKEAQLRSEFTSTFYHVLGNVKAEIVKNTGMEPIDHSLLLEDMRLDSDERHIQERYGPDDRLFCAPNYSFPTEGFFLFAKEKVLDNLDSKFLKWNIIDWNIFRKNFLILGKFLSPITWTTQCGEHKMVKRIYEKALKIIREDIKKRGDE
jgi:hypothetical protein